MCGTGGSSRSEWMLVGAGGLCIGGWMDVFCTWRGVGVVRREGSKRASKRGTAKQSKN